MQGSEKQFNPVHPENSSIYQEKEIEAEGRFINKGSPENAGVINAPESIIDDEKGVRKDEGEKSDKRPMKKRTIKALEMSQVLKRERMDRLTRSLQAIDKGENIEEFDKERRTIYYDDLSDSIYVMDGGKKKNIGVGDILSDYVWGIKYVPDPEMPHSIFRRLSRRILINEARRDIEDIYNLELARSRSSLSYNSKEIYTGEIKESTSHYGLIAEAMARELLARVSYNKNLGFIVLRANAVEDSIYKIDFKIHISKRKRGVELEDEKDDKRMVKKLGIQMWGKKMPVQKKIKWLRM